MAEMTCKELVELVTAYFDGALDTDDHARFERHLTICPGCVNYVEQMRQTVALAGGLREEDVSPDAERNLLQAFRDWKRETDCGLREEDVSPDAERNLLQAFRDWKRETD